MSGAFLSAYCPRVGVLVLADKAFSLEPGRGIPRCGGGLFESSKVMVGFSVESLSGEAAMGVCFSSEAVGEGWEEDDMVSVRRKEAMEGRVGAELMVLSDCEACRSSQHVNTL